MSGDGASRCSSDGALRILRMPAVMRRVGLSRSSIYSHQRRGDFPRSVPLGPRAVGFVEHEIEAWIAGACGKRSERLA